MCGWMASNFILKHDYAYYWSISDSHHKAPNYIIRHQFICFLLLITNFRYQKLICIDRHKFVLLGTHFFIGRPQNLTLQVFAELLFSHNPSRCKHIKRLMAEGKVKFFTFTLQLAPLIKTLLKASNTHMIDLLFNNIRWISTFNCDVSFFVFPTSS